MCSAEHKMLTKVFVNAAGPDDAGSGVHKASCGKACASAESGAGKECCQPKLSATGSGGAGCATASQTVVMAESGLSLSWLQELLVFVKFVKFDQIHQNLCN